MWATAVIDWFEAQEARRNREGENPVPHYWDHVLWVWGASDMNDLIEKTRRMHLNGVAERITARFLITHGVGDRQINVKNAHRTFEQTVNTPKRELRLFADPEGGTEHISLDNMPCAGAIIADWIAETFEELSA